MRFRVHAPYLHQQPTSMIPCSAIGLPDPHINARFRFVWHWDVLGPDKFGPGYSISEYISGRNLVWGFYRLDDAVKAAVEAIKTGRVDLDELLQHPWNWMNDPENYFLD